MNRKKILIFIVIAASVSGLCFFFYGSHRKKPEPAAQEFVKSYFIDKDNKISFSETFIPGALQPASDADIKDGISGDHSDHNLADYLRFLQTNIGTGTSLSEQTEAIHQHLLSFLPGDKAEEAFELYKKFARFEIDVAQKGKEWTMPETASETLELIGNMQRYQQEYFGNEVADHLFGSEMKVMEYNARRAGIINDTNTPGLQKEELLNQLARDMWGDEAQQEMNKNKDPYDILDEKLLIYADDLAALSPAAKEAKIKEFRAMYLPQGY